MYFGGAKKQLQTQANNHAKVGEQV